MQLTDTVIIFASTTGHTRKIAKYLAEKLDADIFDLKQQSLIDLSAYSRVIIGTGVHAENAYGKVIGFLDAHPKLCFEKEVYLFISCLLKGDRADSQCHKISDELRISNAVYFSSRSEKNEAGLSCDVDAFIERMKA